MRFNLLVSESNPLILHGWLNLLSFEEKFLHYIRKNIFDLDLNGKVRNKWSSGDNRQNLSKTPLALYLDSYIFMDSLLGRGKKEERENRDLFRILRIHTRPGGSPQDPEGTDQGTDSPGVFYVCWGWSLMVSLKLWLHSARSEFDTRESFINFAIKFFRFFMSYSHRVRCYR